MEVSINVNENWVQQIKRSSKKDLNSIIVEALEQCMKNNLLKCPIDEDYCTFNEPCNNCSKTKLSKES